MSSSRLAAIAATDPDPDARAIAAPLRAPARDIAPWFWQFAASALGVDVQ